VDISKILFLTTLLSVIDMNISAIIPARGGSKGIPRKNLTPICGKPLIAWSIIQATEAKLIDEIYVTSDDDEILHVAASFGAIPIKRPATISHDHATSESAWIHAIEWIKDNDLALDLVVGMQATSPIRHAYDLDNAICQFLNSEDNSLMAVNEIEDFHIWQKDSNNRTTPFNYDYKNRARRQNIQKKYLENGSFYIFKPNFIKSYNNRLVEDIGIYIMEKYKMFQIDEPSDILLCEAIMRYFIKD
jgi:CMP-N,N'-diacetyllegionaminic acid synthase